jgi:4-hydroxy-tetrahydrodipicolinate synthase
MMNQRSKLSGVITAVLTPFDADGHPHIGRLQDHIRRLETQGCDAVLLAGTTGEGPSLSLEERKTLVEAATAAAVGVKLLVCTTCASLPETVELTRHAFDQGAYGVTVMPPFFFKDVSDEGLYAFYRQVLDQGVPDTGRLLLYHIPQVTGVQVSFGLVARLLEGGEHRVAGIKDSAGDLEHCQELCRRFPTLSVFTGNDQFILEALRSGARGCVTGLVNVFAPLAVGIYQAFRTGDPEVERLQSQFTQLWSVLERYQPYPALMKALLALQQDDPQWVRVRPPLVAMSTVRIKELLEECSDLELPAEYAWLHIGSNGWSSMQEMAGRL